MAGMMKSSGPKNTRQAAEAASPTRALVWSLSLSHCSRKMTTNMAVITKSSPSVLNWMSPPKTPPRVEPENQ